MERFESRNIRKGSELHPEDRQHVLASYLHRYTKEHVPTWARESRRRDGSQYPVQFESDQEWLENTYFHVKNNGRLNLRYRTCESHPTWPDGEPAYSSFSVSIASASRLP